MTKTKATAPAEQSPAPEKADEIYVGTVRPVKSGDTTSPHLFTKGEAPRKGAKIKFRIQGGRLCSGIVKDAVESGGDVLVEFRGGITAQQ